MASGCRNEVINKPMDGIVQSRAITMMVIRSGAAENI
jgi:hypothetical protein